MTRWLKRLGFIIFFGIQTLQGFCQDRQPWTVFQEGHSLLKRDKNKANALIAKALNMSRDQHDWKSYGRIASSAGRIAILDKEYYRAGKVAHQNNELYDSAFQWTKDALSNRKVLPKDTTLAAIFYNAGEFYSSMYQVDLPVQYYKQAIKLLIPLSGELTKEVADCYHGLGDVYKYNKFDFLEAEKCYEKALSIREKIHFDDTEALYKNYYSLAATNRSQRDFEKALSYGSVALSLSHQLITIYEEITNAMIANIYRDMRASDMARSYYMAALKLNATTKNLENRAWYYQCLGETLENDTLYDEAIGYFLKADALYATMNKNDKRLFSTFLIRMSHTYSLKNDAGKFFETMRRVFDELRTQQRLNSMEAAESYVLIGDYYKDRKQYDSATVNYQKALHVAVPSFHSMRYQDNPTDSMIELNYYAGTILAKKAILMRELFLTKNNKEYLYETLECLTLAERLLSQERNTLDTEDAKWSFLDANYDIYDHIIGSLYDGENVLSRDSIVKQAYSYFEKSKSRSLADALFQAEQARQISAKDTLLKSHAFLKSELFRAESKINQLMNDDPSSKELNKLREEIVSLDKQAQRVKTAIESKYPGYFSVQYGYDMPLVGAIQKNVQSRNEVIMEYFWGSKWVYGLAISADSVLFKRLGRPEILGRTINQLLTHVTTEHSSTSVEVFNSFTSSAAELYRLLVSPFAAVIAPGQRIQIIPDGAITQIPFEILLTSSPVKKSVDYRSLDYLLKANSIGYAYSSAMLIRKNQRVVRRPTLLAIGFTGGQRLRAGEPIQEELEEIEGAEKELEALANRFKDGKFLVEKEATESNFKTLSPDFDIIHLAIHGKGDAKSNFSASLYFRSRYDSIDDGEFHAYELYGLKLKALMAVLSSCESGLGKGYKGEGMISMASAFTFAGCENTLMSLWKVNDQASTTLMDDFYQHLLEGEEIDDALREAKLNYLTSADELTADPKTWAPLVAYGSLHQIFKKDRSNIYLAIIGSIVTVALLTFLMLRRKKITEKII